MLELNFHDEQYLPFEGASAVFNWKLEVSGKWNDSQNELVELSQFNFNYNH